MGALLAGLTLTAAAFAAVFWLLHPYVLGRNGSALAAGVAALCAAALSAAPWPDVPLAAVLYERGRADVDVVRVVDRVRERRRRERIERAPFGRFSAAVDFAAAPGGSSEGWTRGAAGDRMAWLDESSGLVWAEALELEIPDYSMESWKRAVAACKAASPAGRWALPSMTEFLRAKKSGLSRAVDDLRRSPRWYATVFVPGFDPLMGLFAVGPSDNAAPTALRVGVRCVGRTTRAPAEGYPIGANEDALGP